MKRGAQGSKVAESHNSLSTVYRLLSIIFLGGADG